MFVVIISVHFITGVTEPKGFEVLGYRKPSTRMRFIWWEERRLGMGMFTYSPI